MKKSCAKFFLVLFLLLTFSLISQELKVDNSFLIGKLDNEFTYYIKENRYHKNKASLRLLIKVGSALETEEERGVAHFIEHLVFRGSENYKDYEIVKYLESIGAEFGPDTNAFTTYDRTCYMLEIPLKNEQDLEKGFSFLSDFAFKANFEEEKIEMERPIILDEFRSMLGPEMRVFDKHLKVILQNTSYEDKHPIGKEKVIRSCSKEIIKNFYEKWYTPQNMAIIAVGDFDKNQVEKWIKKYFSEDVKNNEVATYFVNDNEKMNVSIINDPEISIPCIDIVSRYNFDLINSDSDFKDALICEILINILNERFETISAKADPDFISAVFFEDIAFSNFAMEQLSIVCWEEKILEGLESALKEIKKLKNIGVYQEEFQRAIRSIKDAIKKQKNNLNKNDNEYYIADCFNHFIYGEEIYTEESFLEYGEMLYDSITFDEVLISAKDFDINYLCDVCITLPQNAPVNEADIYNVFQNAQDLVFFREDEKDLNKLEFIDFNMEIEPKIKEITKNDKTKEIFIEFSNGLKLFLKPTDLQKDEILIRSFAVGGIANVEKNIYDSAQIALSYFYNSGIAGINSADFYKLLDYKNSSLHIDLSYNIRNISASATKESFEDILKLINRLFTEKKFQNEMWDKTIKIEKEKQKYMNINPEAFFIKRANEIFTCDSYLLKEIDFDNISLENAQNVIDTFFSNPKDFTFFIVGDFDADLVLLNLQKYLGSISNKESKIEMNNLVDISFPNENKTQIVRAGQEDKSFCVIGYDTASIDASNQKDWYLLKLMRLIIKDRLLKSLRIQKGQTYEIMNYSSYYFYPNLKNFNYFIAFSGPQNGIDSIRDISVFTIEQLIQNGAKENELNTAKKILENRTHGCEDNSCIINAMMSSRILGYENSQDLEKILTSITLKQFNSFVEKLFSKDKLACVIWMPKEK